MNYKGIVLISTTLIIISLLTGCGIGNQGMTNQSKEQHKIAGTEVTANQLRLKWLNVSYASVSHAENLDIYLPNHIGDGPFPVILNIHGGAFRYGKKEEELSNLQAALNRGYAVVTMNYRLSEESRFPAQIQDVKAAIRFLRANASTYHLNPTKIATWGSSAGGYLAALAGTSGGNQEFEGADLGNANQSSSVQAVVDWFGPINFLTMDDQFKQSGLKGIDHNTPNSAESQLLGDTITNIPDLVKKANPETYISKDDPPFFIQHGSHDTVVPVQQSTEFAANLEKVIGKDNVMLEVFDGAKHMDPKFRTTTNIEKALDFLDKTLK
ncbi:prolyl oligopeptidase family serine peptidase [Ectobacillus sp. sgz5001026]|uniref:prolyl oligopeptidase family serine peptidase n=1 Tax=Ectobacillus sp. sgz5001026 TaxID=3242473 RepID=UPI0036D3E75A